MPGATGPPTDRNLVINEAVKNCHSILSQTAAPTLLLDSNLRMVFFTTATTLLVNMLETDLGRSIADLCVTGFGEQVTEQAGYVLAKGGFLEHDLISHDQRCYRRRITRFVAPNWSQPGILITFTDQTAEQLLAVELANARREIASYQSNHLSTLWTLSHDLRQPLQKLELLQALLRETLHDTSTLQLAAQIGEALSAMSGTINTMLEDTSIAPGSVVARQVNFRLNTLFEKMGPSLRSRASECGITLRIVPCREFIHSDPALLEQMLMALLNMALALPNRRRLLVGGRRHEGWLGLEVRVRGDYVVEDGMDADLAHVQRLGPMLGHQFQRRPGARTGTIYSICIALSPVPDTTSTSTSTSILKLETLPNVRASAPRRRGIILVVVDDRDRLKLLGTLLHHQGYEVAMALDSTAALSWLCHSGLKPDLILADYHLGTGANGLELIATLREQWHSDVPAIVLTGDVTPQTSHDIAAADCTQMSKPAKLKELLQLVHSVFAPLGKEHPSCQAGSTTASAIYIVDDDKVMRDAVRHVLQSEHYQVSDFATCEAFMQAYSPQERACLVINARLPGTTGLELLRMLRQKGDRLPTIIVSASGDTAMAVEAMKAGAWDFIEKPCDRIEMLNSIHRALERSEENFRAMAGRQGAIDDIATLTTRQRQIMDMVLAGHPSKNIAADLGISQRTVESHRASIMTRTHSRSIPALARLALAATLQNVEDAKDSS